LSIALGLVRMQQSSGAWFLVVEVWRVISA